MTASGVLDVLIGLILVYLILSFICSGVNEWIASALKKRTKFLEEGVKNLLGHADDLHSDDLKEEFFSLPMIRALSRKGTKRPSYINSKTFSLAFLDKWVSTAVGVGKAAPEAITQIEKQINALPNEQLKQSVLTLWKEAGADLERFRKGLERWFDDAMDRVSGWYKRNTRIWLFVIGLFVTSFFNADTIRITTTLWTNPTVRSALVQQAQETQASGSDQGTAADLSNNQAALQKLPLPIGWNKHSSASDDPRHLPASFPEWLLKILGLLVTAAALSLGAPFWFNTLGKALGLRSSGPRPKKADESGGT